MHWYHGYGSVTFTIDGGGFYVAHFCPFGNDRPALSIINEETASWTPKTFFLGNRSVFAGAGFVARFFDEIVRGVFIKRFASDVLTIKQDSAHVLNKFLRDQNNLVGYIRRFEFENWTI